MIQKKRIFVAVLNQGNIRPELVLLLHELSNQDKYDLLISYPSDKPIAYNRNKIVQRFLSRKDMDYLMMIDSDIVPPENILNLVDYQKDIITPVLFAYQGDKVLPLAVRLRKEDGFYTPIDPQETTGLQEVDGNGTGCMIIKRNVLEKIRSPFLNRYDADGMKKLGLDFAFCRDAKAKGFSVWCHFDYICDHYTVVNLKDIYASLLIKN